MPTPVRTLIFGPLLAWIFWIFHWWWADPLDAWLMGGAAVAGCAAWWLLVEGSRIPTRWRGAVAGAVAGAAAVLLVYTMHFVEDEFLSPQGVDPMILLPFAGAIVLFPYAAAYGVLLGAPTGFLYQQMAGPYPPKTEA